MAEKINRLTRAVKRVAPEALKSYVRNVRNQQAHERRVSVIPPKTLDPALIGFMESFSSIKGEYTPSLFWEHALDDFRRSNRYGTVDGLSPSEVETMVQTLGFGFEDLASDTPEIASDSEYLTTRKLINHVRSAAQNLSANGFGIDKHTWEHARALDFLNTRNLLQEYEDFLRPLRVKSSMSVARHFFYQHQIHALAIEHIEPRRIDIFEIGAGAGNLAMFLHHSGLVRDYWIIDLPEMLLNSGFTISKYLPQAELVFNEIPADASEASNVRAHPRFIFLTPRFISNLPSSRFDLCININSLAEMDETQRDSYIAEVYRVSKNGSVFYNVNRRNRRLPQREGIEFDNNPLLYPYDPGDQVLIWEEDAFQTATRSEYGRAVLLAVTRAAIVHKRS